MPLSADYRRYDKLIRTADYECDLHNRMKVSYLLRHMQEISAQHLDALDLPYTLLAENRQVFLLSKIDLHIRRRPVSGETVRMVTTPKRPRGAQFIRCNALFDADGQQLLHADTSWMLVDPVSRKILRPGDFIGNLRFAEDASSPLPRRRLMPPDKVEPVGERVVRFSDLDVNDHLNNAGYADLCFDFLPEEEARGREPVSFYIHFCAEARLGERLLIGRGQLGPNDYYLRADKADVCCFEAEIKLRAGSEG